mgnify:CR=1 FL=1
MQEFLILIIYQLVFKSIFIFLFWRSKNIPKKRTKKLRENAYNMEYIKRIHNRLDGTTKARPLSSEELKSLPIKATGYGAAYGYAIMQILLDLFIYKNEVINEDVLSIFKCIYIVVVLLLCVFPILIICRANRIFDDTDKFEKKRMVLLEYHRYKLIARTETIIYKLKLGTLDDDKKAIVCKKCFYDMPKINDDYELILYKGKPIDVAKFKCVRG